MAETDILPQDGEAWYDTPKDQKQAENLERAKFFQSLPIFNEIVDWLKQQAEAWQSVENIETERTSFNGNEVSRTVSIEAQVLAMKILHQNFTDKVNELERRKAEFKDDSGKIEDVKSSEKPKT